MSATDLPQGFWYDTVDSTMDEARRLIEAGRIQGTAYVVANHQAAGRGTRGRTWLSPEGEGIYLSVVHLPVGVPAFEATTLYTLAAGVACVEAIREASGVTPQLKPINDLYVGGCKLGGILVESELGQNGITRLITGVGINIRGRIKAVPRQSVPPVSLQALLPEADFEAFSQERLVEALVGKICFWYALLFSGQTGQVQRTWDAYCLR